MGVAVNETVLESTDGGAGTNPGQERQVPVQET